MSSCRKCNRTKRTPGSLSRDDDHCYLCLGTDVQCSNGRNEILFLFVYEPEEFTIHAIFKFMGESSLNFPETEGPRNGPARSPSVRPPVDTVQAGFRSGRADPKLLGSIPSGGPPAFPELPAVDLGHGLPTLPLLCNAKMTQSIVRMLLQIGYSSSHYCVGMFSGFPEYRTRRGKQEGGIPAARLHHNNTRSPTIAHDCGNKKGGSANPALHMDSAIVRE